MFFVSAAVVIDFDSKVQWIRCLCEYLHRKYVFYCDYMIVFFFYHIKNVCEIRPRNLGRIYRNVSRFSLGAYLHILSTKAGGGLYDITKIVARFFKLSKFKVKVLFDEFLVF